MKNIRVSFRRLFEESLWFSKHLEPKTVKLLKVSVQVLVFATFTVLQFCVDWIKWVWVGAAIWSMWRFVLRHIIFGYELCCKCGRIKKRSAMDELGLRGRPICRTCMNRHDHVEGIITKIEKSLESIAEMHQMKLEEERLNAEYEKRRRYITPPTDDETHEHV